VGKTFRGGALPTFITIGAMKCGTTALHRYMALHPEIALSNPKELCFFFNPPSTAAAGEKTTEDDGGWSPGNWHREVAWYAKHFDGEARARGESSPGYTSPSNPYVAERMAALIPRVKLIYLVRDPVERAISHYLHHRRDGTEPRTIDTALLDPHSQYMSRSRYHERLTPFLVHFPLNQIAIVPQEELVNQRRATLSTLFDFVGVDRDFWSPALARSRVRSNTSKAQLERQHRNRLVELFSPDTDNLRRLTGRDFPNWSL
jgi:sulfotransferase family protein